MMLLCLPIPQKSQSSTIPTFSMRMQLTLLLLLLTSSSVRSFTFSSSPPTIIPPVSQRTNTHNRRTTSLSSSKNTTPSSSSILTSETNTIARKKLIQKAKEIDPSLQTSTKGSYCNVGWSNRLGTVLTPVSTNEHDDTDGSSSSTIYSACRPFYWNKIDVGGRMTVIELPNPNNNKNKKSDLFIHSPVQLDEKLQDALQSLGNVKYIVSPNYEHVKYAKSWGEAYPNAYMIACPGMMEREPDVNWTNEIPYGYRPSSFFNGDTDDTNTVGGGGDDDEAMMEGMWDYDIIQPLHIDLELNPFTNKPFFNEVVFYHTPTKTLLTTDIYWNYPNSDGVTNSNYKSYESSNVNTSFDWELAPNVDKIPFGTKLWKIGMDKVYRPFYLNLMIPRDKKEEFEKVASFISGIDYGDSSMENGLCTSSWDIETIIPCHGDITRGSEFVRQVLRTHFKLDE